MTHDLTPEATAFFAELEADNSKDFWHANKDRYHAAVRTPFAAILDTLEPEWGPFKTFRVHRDVRFSADKSPYKTMQGAASRTCSYRYLHIDKDGILLVAGAYIFTKEQLSATRERLADEKAAAEFLRIVADLEGANITLEPGGAAPLKTAPRGTDPDHPMIKYLRWKGMMATGRISLDRALDVRSVTDDIAAFWCSTRALTEWLEG